MLSKGNLWLHSLGISERHVSLTVGWTTAPRLSSTGSRITESRGRHRAPWWKQTEGRTRGRQLGTPHTAEALHAAGTELTPGQTSGSTQALQSEAATNSHIQRHLSPSSYVHLSYSLGSLCYFCTNYSMLLNRLALSQKTEAKHTLLVPSV